MLLGFFWKQLAEVVFFRALLDHFIGFIELFVPDLLFQIEPKSFDFVPDRVLLGNSRNIREVLVSINETARIKNDSAKCKYTWT